MTIGHRTRERRGSILLLVLFLMAVTAPMICLLLDAHATHTRCVHNDIQARTALYLAEAGVQRAVGELVADPDWRAGVVIKKISHAFRPGAVVVKVGESQTAVGYGIAHKIIR